MAENTKNELFNHGTLSADSLLQTDGSIYVGTTDAIWSLGASLPPALPDPDLFALPSSAGMASGSAAGATDTTGSATSLSASSSAGSAGLTINVTYASSAQNYSGFADLQTAVNSAVSFLESEFRNPITIDISLGWGTLGSLSTTVGSGDVGENVSNGIGVTYYKVRNALAANATSADDAAAVASLPVTDPTGGTSFFVTQAQASALGISVSSPHTFDGYVGLNSNLSYSFDPSNRAVAGSYDAIGVLEHEITEVMGRIESLGSYAVSGYDTILDLFRYASSGVRDLPPTSPSTGYFSINGQDLLYQFNNPTTGGDAGDWASSTGPDSFDAFISKGTEYAVSSTDLRAMDVIGYDLACFVAGTQLAGEHGAVAVESLKPGDRVRAHFAGLAVVKWVGQRRIDCARHPDPLAISPVRIAPDAFGPGLPRRTLVLSPEHAVAVDGALIPIRMLVNGGSIVQESHPRRIHYFHVELDRHDLLCAEGLPAESYLDTGNRAMFADAGLPLLLHPRPDIGQAQRESQSCLPLLLNPARVEPLWRRLADRARHLGFHLPQTATTDDAGLRLIVRGRTIRPAALAPGRCCFVVPDLGAGARLVSRQMVPALLQPWRDDRRRLGVMVRGITLHAGDGRIETAMDDHRLTDGWWAAERDATTIWRWTNGDAALPALPGCRMVDLRLGERLAYPLDEGLAQDTTTASRRRQPA